MSGTKRVFYKTPLQRFSETFLIVAIVLSASMLFHRWLPGISLGYPVVAFAAFSIMLVPMFGTWLIGLRGGLSLARDARTRRYIDELGPLGFRQPGSLAGYGGRSSRPTSNRGLFQD